MKYTDLSKEELVRRGQELYAQSLREKVETDENIGKMVLINIETGEFIVGDETGLEAAKRLHEKQAEAPLFGLRIGYRTADALGGVLERVKS